MSKAKKHKTVDKVFAIDTKSIVIPMWETPEHKIKKAFNDGKKHALNHYYNEECDPDWPCGIKSWTVNPYSENRPSAFYSWIAGFSEEYARLVRNDRPEEV